MRSFIRSEALLLLAFLSMLPVRAVCDLGMLDPMAKPTTRFGPHYVLALSVGLRGIEEEELCKQFALDAEGRLQLVVGGQLIEKIALAGLTAAEAKLKIKAAISRYFAVEPDVRVGVARIPRMRVYVVGATFRNGPLVLPDGAHLSDALAEAGFQPGADLQRIQITRFDKDGARITLLPDFSRVIQGATDDKFNDPPLQNGDQISLPLSLAPVVPKTICVDGDVRRPGYYPFKPGMTVRDALLAALDLLPTADPENVALLRTRTSRRWTLNGQRARQSVPTDNLDLEPDDIVFVGRKDSGLRYAVVGAVANPTSFDYKGRPTLKQAIIECGFRPDADRHNVLLIRNMLHDPAHPQSIVIDFDKILSAEQPDVDLLPGDMVQVPAKKKSQSPLLGIGLFLLRHFLPF